MLAFVALVASWQLKFWLMPPFVHTGWRSPFSVPSRILVDVAILRHNSDTGRVSGVLRGNSDTD